MTAAEQHRRFGASVEVSDGSVVLQVGRGEPKILTPAEARAFMFELARANYAAENRPIELDRRRAARPYQVYA